MGAADFAWANGLRRAYFPPERNVLDAHITLFHHLPPSCLGELRQEVRRLAQEPPPPARCERLFSLGRGVAILVVSDGLARLRAGLAERFASLLTPQDMAVPRLHITIQNKVDAATARATLAALDPSFRSRPLKLTGIALWHYRGGPWELIERQPFRGH